jgi:hypothetical protein
VGHYLIGDADILGRCSTRNSRRTESVLVLQMLGCIGEAVQVGISAASCIMPAYDGNVKGFAMLWGRCRRRIKNEKSDGEKY